MRSSRVLMHLALGAGALAAAVSSKSARASAPLEKKKHQRPENDPVGSRQVRRAQARHAAKMAQNSRK